MISGTKIIEHKLVVGNDLRGTQHFTAPVVMVPGEPASSIRIRSSQPYGFNNAVSRERTPQNTARRNN